MKTLSNDLETEHYSLCKGRIYGDSQPKSTNTNKSLNLPFMYSFSLCSSPHNYYHNVFFSERWKCVFIFIGHGHEAIK